MYEFHNNIPQLLNYEFYINPSKNRFLLLAYQLGTSTTSFESIKYQTLVVQSMR